MADPALLVAHPFNEFLYETGVATFAQTASLDSSNADVVTLSLNLLLLVILRKHSNRRISFRTGSVRAEMVSEIL